jgi:hypothetical protein
MKANAKPLHHLGKEHVSDNPDSAPESGVFVAAKRIGRPRSLPPETRPREVASTGSSRSEVTLVVHGWNSVQPGTLSWVFPNLDAAVGAVKAMRNAIRWAILQGPFASVNHDLDEERRNGKVLLEQASNEDEVVSI